MPADGRGQSQQIFGQDIQTHIAGGGLAAAVTVQVVAQRLEIVQQSRMSLSHNGWSAPTGCKSTKGDRPGVPSSR